LHSFSFLFKYTIFRIFFCALYSPKYDWDIALDSPHFYGPEFLRCFDQWINDGSALFLFNLCVPLVTHPPFKTSKKKKIEQPATAGAAVYVQKTWGQQSTGSSRSAKSGGVFGWVKLGYLPASCVRGSGSYHQYQARHCKVHQRARKGRSRRSLG
jgi:hypothetical protein